MTTALTNLLDMDPAQLVAYCGELGEKPFRAKQLQRWIHQFGVSDFDQMTDLAKSLRDKLKTRAEVRAPAIISDHTSTDGTRKWLVDVGQGNAVETVFIPEENRGTLCVSTQAGCAVNCRFCSTGKQGFNRNLTVAEIIGQLWMAEFELRKTKGIEGGPKGERQITNVVMMGMGEPLYNFDHVKTAMLIASDGDGLSLSKRRITLSTSGVVPEIVRIGEETGVMLAISLHAVRDDLRDLLVPINKKYPLKELIAACKAYPGLSNARRITFEYVMLKGVNDSLEDARDLVKLLKGIPAKINLIPFNPWPGSKYECSDWETIEKFADFINDAGYASPIRTPRGRDILAACGQLKSESERMKKTDRLAFEAMMIANHGEE